MKKTYVLLFVFLIFNLLFCDLYAKHERRSYMAINLVTAPTGGAPVSTNDYDAQNQYILALLYSMDQNTLHLTEWDTLTVPDLKEDVYIQHGGALFQVQSSDYSIAGAPASGRVYIKLTRSGDTLTAAFVNSAAGYSWNQVYNGFYHADGTQLMPYVLYKTTSGYHKFTLKDSEDKFDITAFIILHMVLEIGAWNMYITGGGSGVDNHQVSLDEISAYLNDNLSQDAFTARITGIEASIINDAANQISSFKGYQGGRISIRSAANDFNLYTPAGNIYDSVNYNDPTMNRGYIFYIVYI